MEITKRPPLAERMRPTSFDDFVGQEHIIGKNMLLRRAIEVGELGSCIFYGPPGTGKTTLANIVAKQLKGEFRKLNAVSSGVSDAKEIIREAENLKAMFGTQTYLLLDECHRWNKAQSDCVLEAIEKGSIVFIGSTTENPFTSMTRAIVSRCRVFEFKALEDKDVIKAMKRALEKDEVLSKMPIKVDESALKHFAWASSGDVRMALNALELAVLTTPFNKDKEIVITKEIAEQSIQKKALSIDENQYYDMLSAFCKSIRGSDTEAALYWAQRMLIAGIDPMIIARRLVAHSSEDIGMADSNALLLSTSAMYAVEKMGAPEGLIPLFHAIIYACEAEKSNSVIVARDLSRADAENVKDDNVPDYLKNHPSTNDTKHIKYKYPHDFGGYVKQRYMPESLKDRVYYIPSQNGREKNLVRKKDRNN
ncbi:MAG TPA: replication-associated recombination protein A [Candidatus Caccopulliclostridium gallistercoris]|uniref:Replication-associated recombination protein A n=1 Tax=Candidatus Caccopulliclostridium gallistercoris TaxID=2840719 RepID=A0A9D1SYK4_9FIRM|nr:replication-associated recombination protein A [Candidatus Caccopulliclostridium gallistercoris]